MEIERVERIKGIIEKAEIEKARAEGAINSIKKQWKEDYGTDDVEELKKQLEKMNEDKNKLEARLTSIEDELESAFDWDAIEEELN